MTQLYAARQVIPTRSTTSSPGASPLVSSLDGALNTMEWRQARIWEGRGFHITIGAFSTPILGGGAGTIFDQDQPEGIISIPTGFTLLPLRIHVQTQQPLLATDADETEILIAVDRTQVSNAGAGTGTVETIYNMRTDLVSTGSYATAVSAVTVNITNPTLDIELAHSVNVGDVNGTPGFAAFNTKHELLYEPAAPPLIVGPASLIIYWGGTVATSGFAQVQWIEIPTPPTV